MSKKSSNIIGTLIHARKLYVKNNPEPDTIHLGTKQILLLEKEKDQAAIWFRRRYKIAEMPTFSWLSFSMSKNLT